MHYGFLNIKSIIGKNLYPTLEDKSSDILLSTLFRKLDDEIKSHHPISRGKSRPNRRVQLAEIYK